MQTWARRGLQTALVTGGLLMLGTGIASAQEDVNPDRPANPLDGSVSIPVQFKDNAIGTPLGQLDLPDAERTISTDEVTDKLPDPLRGTANEAMGTVGKAASPVTDVASGATSKAGTQQELGAENPARGNKLHGHVAVPIQVAGNAVAAGGPAKVNTDATQKFDRPAPENTSADGQSLGGNVAGLDGAVPVQLANNAVGAGADAASAGQAHQHSSVGGPVTTDGTNAPLGGNALLGHVATPVQLTGNAVAGGGNATAASKAESTTAAGGAIKTSGKDGALSGNVGGAPVALPVELNGNALSSAGKATSASASKAGATAGGTNADSRGNPFYTLTNGDPAALAGNIVQPEVAGPALVSGNAGSLGGNSTTVGTTDSKAKAGGGAGTNGKGSALSGNIVNGPVAYPAQVFGDAATLGGNANAAHANTVDSQAGGSNVTFGDNSALSSNDVVPSLAGSGDVFGSGASLGGNANGVAQNETKAKSGGYVGTTGNDSAGAGNIGHAPLALPVEVFGLGGTMGGNASGTANNVKDIDSGGPPNSNDDKGFAASNIGYLPVSTPVELFGDAAHLGGNSSGLGNNELSSTAGGNARATGVAGTIAGNIAQAPISEPIQGFGNAVGLGGNGEAAGANKTASGAGGTATTDGSDGSLAGNVANLSGGGAGQLFGNTVGGVGTYTGAGDNDTSSVAGGDVQTKGDRGSGSGNVLSGDLLPVLQGFGSGASALANGVGEGTNKTASQAGGDISTSGMNGALSGNLLDVPAELVGQAFGVAGAVGGNQAANGDNSLIGVVGGERTTAGAGSNALSGLNEVPRLGLVAQFFDVPLELLGNALSTATNSTAIDVAGEEPGLTLPVSGSELPISELPALPVGGLSQGATPKLPTGGLPQLGGLPGAGGQGVVPQSAAPRPQVTDAAVRPVTGVLPMNGAGMPGESAVNGLGSGFGNLDGALDLDNVLNLGDNTLPGGVADMPGLPHTQSAGGRHAKPISAPTETVSGDLPSLDGLGQLPLGRIAELDNVLNVGGGEYHTLPAPATPALSELDTSGVTSLFAGKLPTV